MKFWSTGLVISTPVVLGAAAGWVTGLTGTDSTVVAAVLPALLTGGGGALLAIKLRRENDGWAREFLYTCSFVVIFAIFFVPSIHGALIYQDKAMERQREIQRKHHAQDIDFRMKSLLRCSENEVHVNEKRKADNLAPLPPEAFCDISLSFPRT